MTYNRHVFADQARDVIRNPDGISHGIGRRLGIKVWHLDDIHHLVNRYTILGAVTGERVPGLAGNLTLASRPVRHNVAGGVANKFRHPLDFTLTLQQLVGELAGKVHLENVAFIVVVVSIRAVRAIDVRSQPERLQNALACGGGGGGETKLE